MALALLSVKAENHSSRRQRTGILINVYIINPALEGLSLNGMGTIDYTGQARRIDLRLREKYPLLKTKIFRVAPFDFAIHIENPLEDFQKFAKDFHESIRFVTVPVRVVDSIPGTYLNEIPPIPDNDIASDFEGFPFTIPEFVNFIQSKHPEVCVSGIAENFEIRRLTILLQATVDTPTKSRILNTAMRLKLPMSLEVQDGTPKIKTPQPENPVFYIASSRDMAPMNLPFLRRDEELWFDNLRAIYDGTFTKNHLYFFDPNDKSCFIDFSIFRNVNLRNHLLLYDKIFCSLPLLEKMDEFFEDQKISRQDLLHLVEKGRVKIIITQPEFRHDYSLFRDVYGINPNAIISRRAIAALCAIDIVDINKDYFFNDDDAVKIVEPISKRMAEITGVNPNIFVNSMMWPKVALRGSLDSLNSASSKRISNFGINRVILDTMPLEVKKKYEFEFTVSAEAIHIAHALDATYFPFTRDESGYTDQPYVLMMGNALNFFKCFKGHLLREYISIDN